MYDGPLSLFLDSFQLYMLSGVRLALALTIWQQKGYIQQLGLLA